ncbi:hypothetical protein CDAR_614021 [Caerostris darwini]|uniref:Uncharacterized protein n=1 Tax=Caerostris darwini TaxID=1538125 RepID=A0AAV4VTD0_9ARAC|nr:hypothetical protein CDAR_614021 [Caerostris darwini]
MTKRFQTETLGSEFLLRRANIYGIVCKSFRCNITRFNSLQAIPSPTPLPPPLATPRAKRVLHFHSFLISTTAIYTYPAKLGGRPVLTFLLIHERSKKTFRDLSPGNGNIQKCVE